MTLVKTSLQRVPPATTATFSFPQGGRCGEVQLYFILRQCNIEYFFVRFLIPIAEKSLPGNEDLTILKHILVSKRWKILENSALLGIQLITLTTLVSNLKRGSKKKKRIRLRRLPTKIGYWIKVNYSDKKTMSTLSAGRRLKGASLKKKELAKQSSCNASSLNIIHNS